MSRNRYHEPWETEATAEQPESKGKILLVIGLVVALIAAITCACVHFINQSGKVSCGWGDDSGGRPSYTAAEVEEGALENQVVFNSISDNAEYGNEKRYISAELVGGNGRWNYRELKVEDGQTYILRVRVANNGGQTSTNTRVAFSLPLEPATQAPIYGRIYSENGTPSKYWDGILLTCDTPFRVEYIYGNSTLESESLGIVPVGDEIVTKAASENGIAIGYNALDGLMPGGAEVFVTIQIRIVAEEPQPSNLSFTTNAKVRQDSTETSWDTSIEAQIGELVQVQFLYTNTDSVTHNGVIASVILPDGIELVPGTTKIYNSSYDGKLIETADATLDTSGINIENYAPGANAYVRCTVRITDAVTSSEAKIWAVTTVGETHVQDSCTVTITD